MANKTSIFSKITSLYAISYSDIARKLEVPRQLVSNMHTGQRPISEQTLLKLKKLYPIAFETGCNSRMYEIPYCPKQTIPDDFDVYTNIAEKILIDRKLITCNINQTHCRVVTLSDDSLSPVYMKGDKVILDTSQKCLKNDSRCLILYKGNYYLRLIKILPDKVKCISTYDDEDTFIVNNANEINIVGAIVPTLRF